MSAKPLHIHILSDDPANDDAFSGGHKKVASALAQIINTAEPGRIIGLLGGWGSGKSSVVKFLQDELKGKKSSAGLRNEVFVFDAWKHQQDPIRRAFLECLIYKFKLEKKFEDILLFAKKAKEVQQVTNSPKSSFSKSAIAAMSFMAIIGVLLIRFSKETAPAVQLLGGWDENTSKSLVILSGFACFGVAAVILVMAIFVMYAKGNADVDVLAAAVLKTLPTVYENTIVRTPEPTAIEFQGYFRDILTRHFKETKTQLTIVIDNLDRIDTKEALAFWSTLVGFFSHRHENEGDVLNKHTWIILPVDEDALSKIFQSNDNKSSDGISSFPTLVVSGSNAQSFIEKTFAVTLRVPPLVISDWSGFFVENASAVFKDFIAAKEISVEKIEVIRRLVEIHYYGQHLTPRKIKSLLNKIGATYQQVLSFQVNILVCAAYCIFNDKFKNDNDLRSMVSKGSTHVSTEVSQIMEAEEIADWKEQIAVVHFLTEGKKAIEILIGDEIAEALKAGRPEDIDKYSDVKGLRYCLRLISSPNSLGST